MTTVNVDASLADDIITRCQRLGLRLPENQGVPGAAQRTLVWTPDLTSAEQVLLKNAGSAVFLTAAEAAAIQPDIDGLVTYQGIANPTLAQTVLAVKAQSRILRAILRS